MQTKEEKLKEYRAKNRARFEEDQKKAHPSLGTKAKAGRRAVKKVIIVKGWVLRVAIPLWKKGKRVRAKMYMSKEMALKKGKDTGQGILPATLTYSLPPKKKN